MTTTTATPPAAVRTSQQPVFIALQANNDTLPIVQAIAADNPLAVVDELPGLVKLTAPGRLRVCRASIEEAMGRAFDLREVHIHLVSLSGEIDETDDEFTLLWRAA
ncbi:MmoB/DmpM family protein [Aquabacterium sp. OR-4]|uniref:MmoB/DmpM family protein n=1 Tax=Aquabacterium sp. OR-4 TaxID=2978127 RepID=UPI0021B245FA|nr:MmoB/DmpM family protein [Aquabacterium sp. OR-4]MDT7837046.1 MmoB/DmpM family protein [Aquabacterium sp. OR-4]